MEDSPALYDAVVIGAGPAGLTAAVYLARYRRTVLVLHDGKSRALRIPKTHNAPGFPEGIRGEDLIERMTVHAEQFNAEIAQAEVADIEHTSDGFRVRDCPKLDVLLGIDYLEAASQLEWTRRA